MHIASFPGDEAYADYFFGHVPARAFTRSDEKGIVAAAYVKILSADIFGSVTEIPFLTGIATRADARRKGHCRELIGLVSATLKKEGYPFVMLHPFNHDFYSRLGFTDINFMGGFYPAPYGGNYEIKKLITDDWEACYRVLAEWQKAFPGHVLRSPSEQKAVIEMFTKVCGSGYLISRNGIPNAYVLFDDGKIVEACFTTLDAFDGVKELLGFRIPLPSREGEGYSMGKLLNAGGLLRLLPKRGVTLNARFSLGGKTYEIKVNKGRITELNEAEGEAYTLTEGELMRTALGQGKKYPFSPLKELFPEYNLALFEKY